MVRPEAGPLFVDSAKKRWVRSFYNDPGVIGYAALAASETGLNSTSYTDINTAIRVQMLFWANEKVEYEMSGSWENSASALQTFAISTHATVPDIPGGIMEVETMINDRRHSIAIHQPYVNALAGNVIHFPLYKVDAGALICHGAVTSAEWHQTVRALGLK